MKKIVKKLKISKKIKYSLIAQGSTCLYGTSSCSDKNTWNANVKLPINTEGLGLYVEKSSD